MKTTEFLKEYDTQEYNDEAGMTKNSLHTIVRVATHLERELGDNENLPEWVQEKIAQIKGMMVSVMDYVISQHEMGVKPEVSVFNNEIAESVYKQKLDEMTAGGTGAASIGAVVAPLGGTKEDVISRQKSYTNQRTKGGPVKVKKVKK